MATNVANQYREVFDDVFALGKRTKGWNSYDADPAIPEALLGVAELIHSFWRLNEIVPRPAVGLSPDGAVILRWLMPQIEIEIVFSGRNTGEFSVVRRGSREVVREGSLGQVDPLKDVVDAYVMRPYQHAPWH